MTFLRANPVLSILAWGILFLFFVLGLISTNFLLVGACLLGALGLTFLGRLNASELLETVGVVFFVVSMFLINIFLGPTVEFFRHLY